SFQASSLIKIGEKDTSKVPESEPIPVLFVVYSNDAVLVEYSDESTLQLSPCGTVFQFELPPHEVSLLDTSGSRTIQQKSEFATSRFHGKVAEALHLRNMFAWQPCLLPSLMRHGVEWASNYDDELFDSSHFYWPSDPSDWQLGRSTRFSSIDGRAFLTVSANGREICAEFSTRLSTAPEEQEGRFRTTWLKLFLSVWLLANRLTPQQRRKSLRPVRVAVGGGHSPYSASAPPLSSATSARVRFRRILSSNSTFGPSMAVCGGA
uniref:DUF4524 domain-containing protein n=1 Tax=Macrostomum lignano TaxID=282301 RepID=A0A1I8GJ44_9PLAT